MIKRSKFSQFFRKLFGIKPSLQEQKEMAALLAINIQTVIKKLENDAKLIDLTMQDLLKSYKIAKDQNNTFEINQLAKQYKRKKGERVFLNQIHEKLSEELVNINDSQSLSDIEFILGSIKGLKNGFLSNTSYFDRTQQMALQKINHYVLNAESISNDRLKSGDTFVEFLEDNFKQQLSNEAIEKDLNANSSSQKIKNPLKD